MTPLQTLKNKIIEYQQKTPNASHQMLYKYVIDDINTLMEEEKKMYMDAVMSKVSVSPTGFTRPIIITRDDAENYYESLCEN